MPTLADLLRDPQFRTDVGNNARDFLQSASNTAASNVTAPVDGLAWLLRRVGVPVPQAPIGGSDWAQNAGLLAEPRNKTSLASLLGEAAGNIAPIAGYAKAPQIASGLLKADEALQGPASRMVNKYMDKIGGKQNMVVYHGSPHKFDAFDASKIGTGEGAQAYGHGMYLAESPDVAKTYKLGAELGKDRPLLDGKSIPAISNPLPEHTAAEYIWHGNGQSGARDQLTSRIKAMESYGDAVIPEKLDRFRKALDLVNDPSFVARSSPGVGQFYKVDLPDEHIAKMLDWDKPLSQQAPEVQSAFGKVVNRDLSVDAGWGKLSGEQALKAAIERAGAIKKGSGEELLRQAGIPGIRYLDGGSRGAGQGSSNFVVFPGNESLLKILSRNGQNLP